MNDFIFFLDILISFRVSYYKLDGSLQLQQNLISLKYMQTYFISDFIAAIPLQTFERDKPNLNIFDHKK